MSGYVSVAGRSLVDGDGQPVRLRGVNLGGWLLMEGFIDGFASTEGNMRRALRAVLGEQPYTNFFDRFYEAFYAEADAQFLASLGFNCVRLGINYRHLESDDRPFELIPGGFEQLDRAIALNARFGLYSVIDLHAAQGYQSQGWHCDNPGNQALLWEHRGFQDRVVWLWEQIAARYRGDTSIAGYNLLNEPADQSELVLGPFYRRIADAIRPIDPNHVIFLDGNRYAREFELMGDPMPNAAYSVHQYPDAGFPGSGSYPGETNGKHWDQAAVEGQFLQRTAYMRRHGRPIWVSEFGPLYEGDSTVDDSRFRLLRDQLDLYERHGASWTIWSYKDLGIVGLVSLRADGRWRTLVHDFVAKTRRIAAEAFGVSEAVARENYGQVFDLVEREFPNADPYPFGMTFHVWNNIGEKLLAELLVPEFANLFSDLSQADLDELADSFRFEHCEPNERLIAELTRTIVSTS